MLYFAIHKVIGAPDLDEDGDRLLLKRFLNVHCMRFTWPARVSHAIGWLRVLLRILLLRSEMSISFSYCWVSDMKRFGGLMAERDGGSRVDDCSLELKEKGYDGCVLSYRGALKMTWVAAIILGCILRLKGCPKDVLGGVSKLVEFRWVKEKKKDKDEPLRQKVYVAIWE
ncbi:hypothetical protein BHM03_00007665 [Ensete ventricosum]|nr:hypothetical protein BHM03_00007665 [Ensete ventricosum]